MNDHRVVMCAKMTFLLKVVFTNHTNLFSQEVDSNYKK